VAIALHLDKKNKNSGGGPENSISISFHIDKSANTLIGFTL
jgi:hypothetical protein